MDGGNGVDGTNGGDLGNGGMAVEEGGVIPANTRSSSWSLASCFISSRILFGSLLAAIAKSSFHVNLKVALGYIQGLMFAVYPKHFLLYITSNLLKKIRNNCITIREKSGRQLLLMPLLHQVSPNIKKSCC